MSNTEAVNWIVVDEEEGTQYRVKATSELEAVVKWYRINPEFTKTPKYQIRDAYNAGNLNIQVFEEAHICNI